MVTEKQIKLARDKFKEISGITIYAPDEGSLDDFEQSRYDGLVAALEAALSAAEPQPAPSVTAKEPSERMLLAGSLVDWKKYSDKKEAARDVWNVMHRNAGGSAQVQDVATHRHKKRGSEYVLIGVGKMQAEDWFDWPDKTVAMEAVDMREVAIYRSVDDGSLWVRPVEEFNDGRFEPLPSAPAKQ
ncbi:hypothetical protein [Agrobacterium tumefaciens]|uniref:hypothetical protein n=1 Tax=Agrobacterium tumefaciens TaxID=358 RepID=UPI001BA6C386|nr:hypothetical protein [Agrobacterium tumefaciens]